MSDPTSAELAAAGAATELHAQERGAELVTPQQVEELINRLSLRQIKLVRWLGEVPPGTDVEIESVRQQIEPPRVRIQDADVSLWFEHLVECCDAQGDAVARIETGVVADFDLEPGEAPSLPLVSCFADTNGTFLAWPYIREAVQSMSVRLGLAPITLGILRRDDDAFASHEPK